MPNLMQAIEDHIIKSLPEYIAILGLFLVAVIANQPHPETIDKWLGAFKELAPDTRVLTVLWQKTRDLLAILYRWSYDSLQAFMAAKNPRPQTPPASSPTK